MNKHQTRWKEHSTVEVLSAKGVRHVAVIAGGMSSEREVSLMSAQGVNNVLIASGYQVSVVDMGGDIAAVLSEIKPDVVFNCLHGTYGEDGCLPGMLNILRIPYTHSGVLSSALAFNKVYSRTWFRANNIKVADSIIVNKTDNYQRDPMPRPYVIKPPSQGSSIGVEVIFAEDDFSFANYDFPYGDQIIVEKYIKGRDLQVAVLNGKALGALEIKLLEKRFYDYEAKYTEGFAQHVYPASLEGKLYDHLLREAEKIYNILYCRGVARVEFIFDEEAQEFVTLELNTHPGMTPLSIVPEIAAAEGINFASLVEEILKTATYDL